MSQRKLRMTVTVDRELVEAGNRAVARGMANSLSGWVDAALREKVERERALEHLREAVSDYESEFGEITGHEMARQQRADRENAVVVRGRRSDPVSGTDSTDDARTA